MHKILTILFLLYRTIVTPFANSQNSIIRTNGIILNGKPFISLVDDSTFVTCPVTGTFTARAINAYMKGIQLNYYNKHIADSLLSLKLSLANYTVPVQADYTATSGLSAILHKPNSVSTFINDAGYITTVPAQSWASITGKPSVRTGTQQDSIDAALYTPLTGSIAYSRLSGAPITPTYTAGKGISITSNVIAATDTSATNELQTLSIAGSTISLSNGGGSVALPSTTTNLTNSVSGNSVTVNSSTGTGTTFTVPGAKYYNASGIINQNIKKWVGIITPTTGAGQTVDISSAGFGTILDVQIQVANNTASATSVPVASIKSYSTTSVAVNIVVSNNNTIANLLSPIVGLLFATSLTGYTLHVEVTGY